MIKYLLVVLFIVAVFGRNYPMYKQCDSQWANDQLGTSSKTICQAGCLMSSAAMALSGVGQSQNPKTLNVWLKNNGGYASGNLFVWASINKFGVSFKGFVANSQIKANLDAGNIVICNVHNGAHWVLAYKYSGDTIYVNDPGYSTASYTLSQIVNNNNGVYGVNRMPNFVNNFITAIEEFLGICKPDLTASGAGDLEADINII